MYALTAVNKHHKLQAMLPNDKSNDRLIDSAPTWRYVYQYRPSFMTDFPDWMNATHGDDNYCIFGEAVTDQVFNELDSQMSADIMNYYSNFAHTGYVHSLCRKVVFEVEIEIYYIVLPIHL